MMATTEELKQLAHRLIDDDDFRQKLEEDPTATAASLGITLTEEQAESITSRAMQAEEAGLRESKNVWWRFWP